MSKERLIPWLIRNCDQKTFVGMGWVCRKKGILFLDWTRQGNAEWVESDAAREWSKMKGHLKNKQPRDLKAGLRNALRSKEELVKVHIPKDIAEKNGRKRMIWRFLDFESELQKISNPPTKGGQAKKSATAKSRHDMDDTVFEDNLPSCSSTLSDFEYVFPETEKPQTKSKVSKKKGKRTNVASKKQSVNTSISLPPIRTFIRTYSFNEAVCTPPLQYQDISSTFTEARFPENFADNVFFTSQQVSSYPTHPPQKTDIMYDSDEMSRIQANIMSDNRFSYYTCQSSHVLNQSDEDGQSAHSSSSSWNIEMPNKLQNSQVLNQSGESSHQAHPCSPSLNVSSPTRLTVTQVVNQPDGNMNIPHSRLYSSNQDQFRIAQVPNQYNKNCDDAQPYFSPSHDKLQDSASQSQEICDEQMCDSLQRVTSPSLYSNFTFPDLIGQYSGSENRSLFHNFTLPESSQPKEEATVKLDFGAPIDDEENFLNLSQLITLDFNLL